MKKSIFIGLVTGAILLICGCRNIGGNTTADGKAYLSFSVDSARTLNPTAMAESDFTKVELQYKKSADTYYYDIPSVDSLEALKKSTNIALQPGTYDFILKLYTKLGTADSEDVLCQQGTITEKTLVVGTNRLEFKTDYVSDGSGVLDLTFTWPSNVGIESVSAALYYVASNGGISTVFSPEQTLDISTVSTSSSALYQLALPAGNYWLKFKAYQPNDIADVYTDIVKIKVGCRTKNTIEYKGANNWVIVQGDVSIDNRALTIGIDKTDGKMYLNDTVYFTAKDIFNSDCTEGTTFDAKLYYNGKDVSTYYSVENNSLKLTSPLPKAGNYQLYVTATRPLSNSNTSDVYSSQTFDVEVLDEYTTPTTQVALYNYNSTESKYNFYLKDEENVAESLETADFTSTTNKIAFDAFGNVYTYVFNNPDAIVYSTNTKIGLNSGITLASDFQGTTGFSIDVSKNIAYAWYGASANLKLIKYPSLILDGSIAGAVTFEETIPDTTLKMLAIDNNVLYVLRSCSDSENNTLLQLYTYTVSNNSLSNPNTVNLTEYLGSSADLITITDMCVLEGSAYLLVKESKVNAGNNTNDFGLISRGSVLRYDIANESISTIGWTDDDKATKFVWGDNAVTQGRASEKFVINSGDTSYWFCQDETYTTPKTESVTEFSVTFYGKQEYITGVPSQDLSDSLLYGPRKFIALKPKKLVIADSGIAFYTDSDIWKFKNVNRIVTIDLLDFVVENVEDMSCNFTTKRDLIVFESSVYNLSTPYFNGSTTVYGSDKRTHVASGSAYACFPCGDE